MSRKPCCADKANHEEWDCACSWGCDCCDIRARCRVCFAVVDTAQARAAKARQERVAARRKAQGSPPAAGWTPARRNKLAQAVRNAGLADSLRLARLYIDQSGGWDAVAQRMNFKIGAAP